MEQYEKKLKGMSICSVPFRKSKSAGRAIPSAPAKTHKQYPNKQQ